jgi:hypothetical protein
MNSSENDPRGYGKLRHPELPWGYWLRQDPGIKGLIDEEGRVWPSVPDYLWQDRLGMFSTDENCELLLAVLHAMSNRRVTGEEAVHEFFDGIWCEANFFLKWLYGQDLTNSSDVTVEGFAIMSMLAATREIGAPDLAPLHFPTLQPWNGLDKGVTRQQRERIMAAQEALGRALRYRFVREPVIDKPGIKLIGYELGNNIPLTRVLWALAFPDDYARDRMYAWIAHHLDRWQAWGKMAASDGSRALSEHLLQLKFANELMDLG